MTLEFPLWTQDQDYSARLDRMLIHSQWDEGVMDLTAFKVSQTGAGGFTVDVSTGMAVVAGDDEPNQGSYLIRCTATEVPTVGPAPGSNSRYDIVVLRMNDTTAGWTNPSGGGTIDDVAQVVVIAGVAAASPTVPATPTSAILLAVIGPITPGTGSITNSIITDARTIAGSKAVPVGASVPYTGSEAYIPNGYLVEGGQAVLRASYPRLNALYEALGYPYGNGNGTTTFNVRDKRGRVGIGLDNMGGSDAGRIDAANTLGGTGGSNDAIVVTHDHSVNPPSTALSITDPQHLHSVDPPSTAVAITDPTHGHTINHDHGAATSGGGSSHSHGVGTYDTTYGGDHWHSIGGGWNFVIANSTPGGGINVVGGGGTVSQATTTAVGAGEGNHVHDITGTSAAESGHTHTVAVPTYFGSSSGAGTGITASVNIAAFNSASAATGISGSVDIASFTSGSAGASGDDANLPPYILEVSLVRT